MFSEGGSKWIVRAIWLLWKLDLISDLGIFLLCGYNNDRVIIVDFSTTARTAGIFCTIRQVSLSLAFCAKIGVASFAMQYLSEVRSAASGTAVVILSHNEFLHILYKGRDTREFLHKTLPLTGQAPKQLLLHMNIEGMGKSVCRGIRSIFCSTVRPTPK